MLNLTETRHVLTRTPDVIRGLAGAVSDEALDFREAPGTWNVREVLCHLADGELTDWLPRMALILSDAPDRRFAPFDREGGFARYRGWTSSALVDEFARLRADSIARAFAHNLTPNHLARTGLHPEFGIVTLEQLLATWVTHDLAHVAQISRVLVRYFGRAVGPWAQYFSLLR